MIGYKKSLLNGFIFSCLALLLVFGPGSLFAEKGKVEKAEIPLTDPGKPVFLKVHVPNGGIDVTGYSGKSVLVECKPRAIKDDDPEDIDEDDDEGKKKNTKGMFVIKSTGSGLTLVEENNQVTVKVPFSSNDQAFDLFIKVPVNTSMKLKGLNNGFIKVKNVKGDLTVNHLNGPITVEGVSGTVLAHGLNGDIKVTFDKVNLDKPMSFSSMNGDIDVTFPASAKFNLKLKTDRGEIYSDFKLDMKTSPAKKQVNGKDKKSKRFKIKFDKALYGTLNGGGEDVSFKTFNGDIYIRKQK